MNRPQHWLLRIAERSGLGSASQLDLPPDTPMADAWAVLCRRFGVKDGELAAKVAEYYRLDPADLGMVDAEAIELSPEDARSLEDLGYF